MNNRGKLVVAGAAVVFAAAAGSGVAYASGSSDSGSGSAAAHPAASSSTGKQDTGKQQKKQKHGKQGKHRDLARRAVHGQYTVKTKDGYKSILVQRGTITTDTGSSITVTSPDHYVHTYKVGSSTHVRVDKDKASADKLATKQKVVVTTGPKTGTDTALIVVAHKG